MNSLLRCNNHTKSAFADYRPWRGRGDGARHKLRRGRGEPSPPGIEDSRREVREGGLCAVV